MQLNQQQIEKLESSVIGCSLSIHWWGITKKADLVVIDSIAETLGTNSKFLKIEKKLINPKNIYYRNLLETKSSITSTWKDLTLPYVEAGTRLLKKDLVNIFEEKMATLNEELQARVIDLGNNYQMLKEESQASLGSLFNQEDYPQSINGFFSFSWEYPNLNPPEYLLMYNPELYRRQQELVRAKFEEAVQKAEKAFGGELQEMVTLLVERMQPNPDGSRKKFMNSTVSENFKEFFQRFKNISVTNSQDLQNIVSMAEGIIDGVNPEYLKSDGLARQDLANKMSEVSRLLESKIGVQPRRKIIREEHAAVGAA